MSLPSPAPILVTFQTAAEQLSVSTRTIRRMVDSGSLPVVKIGASTRIPYQALIAYAEGNECRIDRKAARTGISAIQRPTGAGLGKVLELRLLRKQRP